MLQTIQVETFKQLASEEIDVTFKDLPLQLISQEFEHSDSVCRILSVQGERSSTFSAYNGYVSVGYDSLLACLIVNLFFLDFVYRYLQYIIAPYNDEIWSKCISLQDFDNDPVYPAAGLTIAFVFVIVQYNDDIANLGLPSLECHKAEESAPFCLCIALKAFVNSSNIREAFRFFHPSLSIILLTARVEAITDRRKCNVHSGFCVSSILNSYLFSGTVWPNIKYPFKKSHIICEKCIC